MKQLDPTWRLSEFSDPESESKILRMDGSLKSPMLETWVMEPTGDVATMDLVTKAGVAESVSLLRVASFADALVSATLLLAESYSEARRWMVQTWLSESRSHVGNSPMRAESSE